MKINKEFCREHADTILNSGTLAVWLVICLAAMLCMLVYASGKIIVIADGTAEGSSLEPGAMTSEQEGTPLQLNLSVEKERQLRIPLSKVVKADSVVVENRYENKELWIYISDVQEGDFQDAVIEGRTLVVESGYMEPWDNGIVFKLKMKDVYEYRITLNDHQLAIGYYEPHELYDTVVVVDAAGGGKDSGVAINGLQEKEITLQVVQKLQQFSHEQIKIYFTRRSDVEVTPEERIQLVEDTGADIFLSLTVMETDTPETYGITGFYNDTYYIPTYGNPQVADALTRNVTIAASNKALGLVPAQEDSILGVVTVPAAQVSVGYLSNEQEHSLLGQEIYVEKLAQGVQGAILEMHESLHSEE